MASGPTSPRTCFVTAYELLQISAAAATAAAAVTLFQLPGTPTTVFPVPAEYPGFRAIDFRTIES